MEITLKDIEGILKKVVSEEALQPYEYLGAGLYRLPNGTITSKKGVEMYINELRKEASIEINKSREF